MNLDYVKINIENSCAWITIDKEKSLNALNDQVLDELKEAIESANEAHVKAIVITGSGGRAFVAGADISEMQDLNSVEASAFCEKGQSVFNMLENSKAISVAMVDGFALGGGFELALACDVIFASSQSKFGLPEVGLGLIPGFGGTQRLSRSLGLHLAKALTLSGDMVDAHYLESKALIYKVAENREALETEVKSYLKRVLSKGPKAVDTAKSTIQEGYSLSFKEALKHEKQEFALLFGTKETEEGMTAFLEKRKPNF